MLAHLWSLPVQVHFPPHLLRVQEPWLPLRVAENESLQCRVMMICEE